MPFTFYLLIQHKLSSCYIDAKRLFAIQGKRIKHQASQYGSYLIFDVLDTKCRIVK